MNNHKKDAWILIIGIAFLFIASACGKQEEVVSISPEGTFPIHLRPILRDTN
jgi:hypothetical protein